MTDGTGQIKVSGVRCQVSGGGSKEKSKKRMPNVDGRNIQKREPQNRRISNIECRRVVSLRSVFFKMDRIHLFDVRCWTFDVRCSLVSFLI